MSLYWVFLVVGIIFLIAYFGYGKMLARHFGLNQETQTPACQINDGIDFVPTKKVFLLGQHFSAIAAAGPIVGPILAAVWFGWLPVLLWIVIGAVFFGAVHDFASLTGSIRHKACSIVEIVHIYLGKKGYILFLIFVWLSLLYVITAFTDLTSSSFVDPELGAGVATSSILYLLIGLVMGISLYKFKLSLGLATLIFLPLVGLAIWFGQQIPTRIPSVGSFSAQQIWNFILLGYCFVASIIPVWLLLQPRGYLGGFFLYATLAVGVFGLLLGGEIIQYPAFIGWTNPKGAPLFPLLFVTVACGACSGFHGIVSSGTTSKQIEKEPDCQTVGYGGMLLEGLVALIALSTVMVLVKGDPLLSSSPDRIYAEGLSRFFEHFGISRTLARSFTLLAFTTFIYDTLDVATRLARYIFQELTGWQGLAGRLSATFISLLIPLCCVTLKMTDAAGNIVPAWKIFWTIFGTSNQLLAALTLMILSIWLMRSGKSAKISFIPMMFMLIMTLWSLVILIKPSLQKILHGSLHFDLMSLIAVFLFVLAISLIWEAIKSFKINVKPA